MLLLHIHVATVFAVAAVAVSIVVAACSLTLLCALYVIMDIIIIALGIQRNLHAFTCAAPAIPAGGRSAIREAFPQTATEYIQLQPGKEIKCTSMIDTCMGIMLPRHTYYNWNHYQLNLISGRGFLGLA